MIVIIGPSLDIYRNIGGISSIIHFIISNNKEFQYKHFEIGKHDEEKRNLLWFYRILKVYFKWSLLIICHKDYIYHFNLALNKRSIIRDSPLIVFARIFKRKLIIHLHGGEYLEKNEAALLLRKGLVLLLKGIEPKVVLSSVERELIEKKYFARNIYIIPNSVDLNAARNNIRNYSEVLPLRILFLGRIDRAKGLDFILEAFKILKKRGVKFHFAMAGKGTEEKIYIQSFSQILGSDFEFMGLVTGEEKNELLRQSEVFLLPSFFEGLPVSLLESMSFSIVPIVTNVGSMKDVVKDGENGLVVGIRSSAEIADAIERLNNRRDLLAELSKNAHDYIFKKYNPDNYLKELNKLYRSLQKQFGSNYPISL